QLVDEPLADDAPPAARSLYHPTRQAEAAALFLHLRERSRRGWAVCVTHTTRAHYLRLDDPDALRWLPVFATFVGSIVDEAAKYADAHSPTLLWVRADGSVTQLLADIRTPPTRYGDLL